AAQQDLEEEYHRFLATPPRGLSDGERVAIRQLAADIPALWHAPTTTLAERKEIIRQVVQRVAAAVQGDSERVGVTITGGGWSADGGRDGAPRGPLQPTELLCGAAGPGGAVGRGGPLHHGEGPAAQRGRLPAAEAVRAVHRPHRAGPAAPTPGAGAPPAPPAL